MSDARPSSRATPSAPGADAPSARPPARRAGIGPRALGALGAAYIWTAFNTTRWRHIGREHYDEAAARPTVLLVTFHNRLIYPAMIRPPGRRAAGLASNNRDGDVLEGVLSALGVEVIRGSSRDPKKPGKDKRGAEAMSEMTTAVRSGAILAVTPDGPRGPRYRVKPGAAILSAQAQTPILPFSYSVARATEFNSWDRFLLPWPFNRGVLAFAPLIPPPPKADADAVAETRARIEADLLAITRAADREMGRQTAEPGPALRDDRATSREGGTLGGAAAR